MVVLKPIEPPALGQAAEDARDPVLKETLRSLTELIVVTLQSDARGRFASAQRLCALANSLQREGGKKKVGDFPRPMGGGLMMPHYGGLYPNQMAEAYADAEDGDQAAQQGMGPYYPGIAGDQGMIARQLLTALQPKMEKDTQAAAATAARDEADELNTLAVSLEALRAEGLETEGVKKRIRVLQARIEERAHAPNPPALPSLVPPELLRGHQAGDDQQGPHGPCLRGPVADGVPGDEDAAQARHGWGGQEPLVPAAGLPGGVRG
jgi:hypothetical protein